MAALRLAVSPTVGDDDTRPLLVSWSIALAAAATWLLVVHLTPTIIVAPATVNQSPDATVNLDPGFGAKRAGGTLTPGVTKRDNTVRHTVTGVADLAGIFAADVARRALDEVTHAIPGVQTVSGDVSTSRSPGSKSALSAATADNTPGRTALGAGNGSDAAGVGRVRQHATVDRSEFHAQPLATVRAPTIYGQVADATELGAFVRGRVAQLQSCYELAGGTDLAGVVALRITVGPTGAVQTAEIVRRSWSGPAAVAAEACLVRVARGWQLPGTDAGATVTFPISFTRGG